MSAIKKVCPILLCSFLFFSYLSSYMFLFFGSCVVLAALGLILNKAKIPLNSNTIIPLFVGILVLIFGFFSMDLTESFTFGVVIIAFTVLSLYIENQDNTFKQNTIRLIYVLTFIHVLATVLQSLVPQTIMAINRVLLNSSSYVVNNQLMMKGSYSGISPQTGTAAFYIVTFLNISIFDFFQKKSVWKLIGIVLGIYALVLTRKRAALLIFLFICLVCLVYYIHCKLKGTDKWFFRITIFLLVFLLIFCFAMMFDSLTKELDLEDLSSGRASMYAYMIEVANEFSFFGKGFGFVEKALGMNGHNIYLQLACEFGMVSLLFFFWFYLWIRSTIANNQDGKMSTLTKMSICFQLFFLLYGLFGNPLFDYFQLGIYALLYSLRDKQFAKKGEVL